MKKYENQLPQQGRGNVQVAYQGKSIDQMIYEFMEEQGIPGMTLAIVQAPYIPRVRRIRNNGYRKGKSGQSENHLADRSYFTRIHRCCSDAIV